MDSGLKVHKVAQVVLDGFPQRLVDLHLTPHHTILSYSSSSSSSSSHSTGDHTSAAAPKDASEIWIAHSLLLSIHLHATIRDGAARTPLVIRSRSFDSHTILFSKRHDARLVYESLEAVVARRVSTEQLYAFSEQRPLAAGAASREGHATADGWHIYDAKKEFARMGVFDTPDTKARTSAWRFTSVNQTYDYCPTYPSQLVVPSKISDATLNYGKAYRSKFRIPGLVYLHWANLGSITRSSQPMVGLKNNRSIQDEKLIEAVFNSHSYHHSSASSGGQTDMANASYISHSHQVYGATPTNLIIDARPTTNAMANVAKGAGTENMEFYRNCKKVYLGIDNIHVMRDSLAKVIEAIRPPNGSGSGSSGSLAYGATNFDLLRRSGWLKHLSCILEGILIVVRAIHLANSHVLVHCSDGWDRTSQLSSISQLCLDPYYRTMEGFAVLIEKDWVSYGHKFSDRTGHLVHARVQFVASAAAASSSGNGVSGTAGVPHSDDESGADGGHGPEEMGFLASMQQKLTFSGGGGHGFKETCPVFDQFLDTVYQLTVQFPDRFQFNEQFLLELQRQLYECKYGNFLFNSEKELNEAGVRHRTRSVWADLLRPSHAPKYTNAYWDKDDREVLFPDPKKVQWWTGWFKRDDMNMAETAPASVPEATVVEGRSDDPVLGSLPLARASDALPAGHGAALGGTMLSPEPAASTGTDRSYSAPHSPASASTRALPISMDHPTITQASTAVQGAMRSAWSAWKSVRQGYEGAVKEMSEAPAHNHNGSGAATASVAAPSGSRPASGRATPRAESSPRSSWSEYDAIPAARKATAPVAALPPAPTFNQPRRTELAEQNPWAVPSTVHAGSGSTEGDAAAMTRADKSANGKAAASDNSDPLGVKVWA